MHPAVRRQSMAAYAPTVVAFSPFSSTPIEFPKCPTNTSVPLRSKPISENSDGEEEEEEDISLALLQPTPKNKGNSPANRRKSLVRSALAFATVGKKSSADNSMEDIAIGGSAAATSHHLHPASSGGSSIWSRKFSQTIMTSLATSVTTSGNQKKGVEAKRNSSIASNTSSDSVNIFPNEGAGIATYSYIKSFFRRKAPSSRSIEEKERNKIGDVNALEEKMGIGERTPGSSTQTSTVLSSPDSGILDTNTTISRNSDVSQNLSPVPTHTDISKSSRTKSSSTVCSEKRNSMGLNPGDKPTHKRSVDQRIFVVWLECIEDMYYFPHDQLFGYTEDGSLAVQPILTIWHLDQIRPTRSSDGCIARRKVIEIDNYQMMHTRRRHSILEFGKKFAQRNNYTEFLEQFIA
uniref:Uncharacterized protein n=1 Tax=Ditylenchus dipsaci TaxID=166011 RepID=A0A915ET45_9BILA